MSIVIDLDPEIEADYAARAAAQGVSLREYLRQVLKEQAAPTASRALSPVERAALWRESTSDLPDTPPLSDDAVSRESIYGPRG